MNRTVRTAFVEPSRPLVENRTAAGRDRAIRTT
jgi:hypothetical protein